MIFSEIYEISGVRRLPVDPVAIAFALGIKVVGYKAAADLFDMNVRDLYTRCPLGFSFKEDENCCIALNENACGEQRRRFTAAHELAHCVLGHLDNETFSLQQECDAERFAADLLAPLVVLHRCGVSSAEEIARICGISRQAAKRRLKQLCERDRSGFCANEDERRTAAIFCEFTESFGRRCTAPESRVRKQMNTEQLIDKTDRYLFIKRV